MAPHGLGSTVLASAMVWQLQQSAGGYGGSCLPAGVNGQRMPAGVAGGSSWVVLHVSAEGAVFTFPFHSFL